MALLLTCRSADVHPVILAAKRCDVVVFKSSSTKLRIGVRALCLTAGRKEPIFGGGGALLELEENAVALGLQV